MADVTASEGVQGAEGHMENTHSIFYHVIAQPLTNSSFTTQCMIFNKSTQSFPPKFTRGLSTEMVDHKTVTFG